MEIPFAPGVGGSGWWFRGVRDQPPIPGTYLELPSGGTVVTELNCNKVRLPMERFALPFLA